VITYRVTLDVPLQLVIKVSNLLRKRRKELGTRNGTRALTCYRQAVFILAWFRDRPGLSRLGQGFGISQATAYRYKDEGVEVLRALAPTLHDTLPAASRDNADARGGALPRVLTFRLGGRGSSSSRLWLFYQGRDVASPVEHTPHVDVILPLDVEDHVREARQRPAAKPVYLQLGCVPGRANGGMLAEKDVSGLERIDEGERSLLRILFEVVTDGVLYVPAGQGAGDDRFGTHPRMLSRSAAKYEASAGPAGADRAPSTRRSRSCCLPWSLRISSRTYSLLVE
jgi:hypothetical protein